MAECMKQNPALVPVAAAAFFVGVWVMAVVLVSLLSGWWGLAEQYRTETPFPAHMRRFQRGQMRWRTNYGNILTVASDSRGLYLSVMFLFRLGHPPLFIPWADISFEDPNLWLFFSMQRLSLGPDRIPLRLRESLVDFLRAGRETSGLDSQENPYPAGF